MLRLKAEIDRLIRDQIFEMVDLDTNLVRSNPNTTLKETPQIDRINHFAFDQVSVGRAFRPG